MGRSLRRAAGAATLFAALAVALSAAPTLAAPLPQDETPVPTPIPEGDGSAQVAARVLVVRAGASTDWTPIGGLTEGQAIDPQGVSPDGDWLLIEFDGKQGWVSSDYVQWASEEDAAGVPVVAVPTAAPRAATLAPTVTPTLTPSPTSAAPTNTPRPTATPSPTTTEILPTETPAPTATDVPTPTDVLAVTPTEAAAAVAELAATDVSAGDGQSPPSSAPPTVPLRLPAIPLWLLPWLGGGLAGLLIVAGGYTLVRGRRQRELLRYADGFPFHICPVCRIGNLELEEHTQHWMGLASVSRMVRCDHCRSVLRQIKPGEWRYTIDPLINPRLAEEYNGHDFDDEALAAFAGRARAYEPDGSLNPPAEESDAFRNALDRLAALEKQVIMAGEDLDEDEDDEPATSPGASSPTSPADDDSDEDDID